MYGNLQSMEEYWKNIEHQETAVDTKVCNGPCFLFAAHLTAGAGGVATAIVRDGHDTGGETKINLAALQSASDNRSFNPPLYFKKGLYLDVGANVTSLLVQFLPARE